LKIIQTQTFSLKQSKIVASAKENKLKLIVFNFEGCAVISDSESFFAE
jgi:hypothetical protein